MTSLEELLLKWRDQSLTKEEMSALNVWLAKPEARAKLREEFDFDAHLLESLQAAKAHAIAQDHAKEYQTREVRQGDELVESGRKWPAWMNRFQWFRPFAWKMAAGPAACAVLAIVFFATGNKNIARLEGNLANAVVLRGDRVISSTTVILLKSGDRVRTAADTLVSLVYLNEATVIKLQSNTHLRLEDTDEGKRLELQRGAITAKVAPQPPGRPMLVLTPQAEAKVVGTEFLLSVDVISTRLEVMEGAVQLANREDGKALLVNSGFYAATGRDIELAAHSLLPAPWQSQDIGVVGLPGSARIEGGQCKIRGSGRATRHAKDQFHFVYQVLEGDGEIRAQVVEVERTGRHAKAGVLIRENLKPDSAQAFLFLRADSGLVFERRPRTEGRFDWVGGETVPFWVRLARQGDVITAYKSPDGVTWTETGSETIRMGRRIYFGLGVSSWNNSALTTSVFANVSVVSKEPPEE